MSTIMFFSGLLLKSCDNGTTNNGGKNPITAPPIPVPNDYPNLAPGGSITITYPATLIGDRAARIEEKIIGALYGLNIQAGVDSAFKSKIDAILAGSLKITIEETFLPVVYGIKPTANGKQLMIETAYIEDGGVSSGFIAGTIIWLINEDQLVAIAPQSNSVKVAGKRTQQDLIAEG